MIAATPEAVKLFHEGTLALANVEANGMRVDMDYIERAMENSQRKINRIEEKLKEDPIYRTWRRTYGTRTKLTSTRQLAHVLFDVLGFKSKVKTGSGGESAGEAALVDIKEPFVVQYRRMSKLQKARGTFLTGIKRFAIPKGKNWFLYPNFPLNFVASYRGSSRDPNFQNWPTRDDEQAKLVRSAFIARKGHRIVESDFSGVEVGIACCCNHDPKLIHDYTEGDMHRDMAMECYMLPKKEVGKRIRYCGKNMFVFPEFYGSYYVDCSQNLWKAIDRLVLVTESGVPLHDHLKAKGIKKLGKCDPDIDPRPGTLEHHIQQVEKRFWGERYYVYAEWKKREWELYKKRGWCKLHSGFVCTRNSDGLPLDRKQTINYQIQGPAFHCLLWVLVRMDKWLRKHNMRSKIVSQIHDSIIADVHEDELDAYLEKINHVMTVELPRAWPWIIVRLAAEMEVCPAGGNWYQKEKVEL